MAACGKDAGPAPVASATSAPSPVASPSPPPSAPAGLDASKPELAPDDAGFVDARKGWGWSDRCWKSLEQGRLGHARAQCDEGLKVSPEGGGKDSARPSLLYNLGLIAEKSGDLIEARRRMEESIKLRPNDEVAAALRRVGGTPPPACEACKTQEDFDAVMKKGAACCPVTACNLDSDCTGGRVCCKIPGGQLCGDASRCTGSNRVNP
jgi:hypothetical protein